MFSFVNYSAIYLLLLIVNVKRLNCEFAFGKVYLNEVFVTLYHQSLENCEQNCLDRPKCQAFSFNTRIPRDCLLNSATATANGLTDRIGWVYQNRSNLTLESPCESCYVNQTCDRKTNSCVYRECESIKNSPDFLLLGNENAVGSRVLLACPSDQYPEAPGEIRTWPIKGECKDTGEWTLPRLICGRYENTCREYLVGPDTGPKTADWSRYLLRDVMLVSGPCGVPDNKMTSSSKFFGEITYWAHWAKFDFDTHTWVSEPGDEHPYLQVEFDRLTEVRGIKLKGRRAASNDMYPTLINITYSTDCLLNMMHSFVPNKSGGTTFAGTSDSTSIVEHMFDAPINALCIRVNILEYFTNLYELPNYFGMKLDFIGTVKLPTL